MGKTKWFYHPRLWVYVFTQFLKIHAQVYLSLFNYFYFDVELSGVLMCLLLVYLHAMTLFVLTSNKKHNGIFSHH